MALPSFTIRSVTASGALDQFFPDYIKIDIAPVFSAVGAVTFDYPENGVNFGLLTDYMELAILVNGVEIPELRCVVESRSGDDATEASDGAVWTFTCHTMLGSLSQAVVYPANWNPSWWNTGTGLTKQVYVSATPGKVLSDFIDAAHSRGSLAWLTYGFTQDFDSAGKVWNQVVDMEFNSGVTYDTVVQNLTDAGLVEVKMNGRQLLAYNPDTIGVDRTAGNTPLVFVKGRDMQSSPRKSSTKDLATVVLMGGANSLYAEAITDQATVNQWGRRESYLSVQHVNTFYSLQHVGNSVLAVTDRPLLEITHSLNFDIPGNPQPGIDFNVGDWGYSDVGRGLEKHRIKQWVISVSTQGGGAGTVTGSVTLNDLIGEQLAKVHRRIANLENGTSANGSSTPTDDGRTPNAPNTVTLSTDYYIDYNLARAVVGASWPAVTTSTDGTATTVGSYGVRWKYTSDNFWRQTTVVSNDTTCSFDNIIPGQQVTVQVAAINQFGHYSGWTAATITTAADTVVPPKPSPATVTSNVGTLRVSWNGLDYQGQQMPADFVGVEVHIGPNGTFTPTSATKKDYLTSRSSVATTITGLAYGTEYWARLVAVDASGNKSPGSDETTTSHAILNQVVQTEIGTGQVGLNNTTFSDVGNLIDDGNFAIASMRAARSAAIAGTHLAFDNTTASVGSWSLSSSPFSAGSSEKLQLQGSLPVKPGERIFGAFDARATSDAVGTFNLGIRWVNSAGSYIDGTGAVSPNVYFIIVGLGQIPLDNTWHPRVVLNSVLAPTNAVSMEIWLFTTGRTAGTIWMDAVEVRRQIDTLLVADAAITTAKIGNLAVNDAQIASASIGKLITGTLQADMLLAARIKTANTGARLEVNSGGLGLWNSSNTQTVSMAGADGSVNITGTLTSGISGRRIEINPFGTGLPEIRFFPTTGSNYGFLNAVSSGASAYVGLNSGQFTANGTTCSYRVYLTDGAGFLSMETIRVDTEAQLGGGIYVFPTGVNISTKIGTTVHGFMDVYNGTDGAAGLAAQIGHDGATTANDGWLNFYLNGAMDAIGNWNRSITAANCAVQNDTWTLTAAASGASWSWPITMSSTVYPSVQLRDSPAIACTLSALSTTGWTASFAANTSGSSGLNWWAWR